MRKRAFFIFLFSLLILAIPTSAADKIKINVEKGIPVVYNPKNPAPPPDVKTKLILKEELCIGDEETDFIISP